MTKTKATLITKGALGNVVVKHVWLVSHGRRKYAQFNSAVEVKYIDKGARRIKGFVETFRPYVVILDGWQDINSQEIFGERSAPDANGTVTQEGLYMSGDSRWASDFEANNELNKVIADYRGVNTHEVL